MDIERCYYCQRIAPEFRYESIAVCANCLDGMGKKEWALFRRPDGEYEVTLVDNPADLSGWLLIDTGNFRKMCDRMTEFGGDTIGGFEIRIGKVQP